MLAGLKGLEDPTGSSKRSILGRRRDWTALLGLSAPLEGCSCSAGGAGREIGGCQWRWKVVWRLLEKRERVDGKYEG